ncbi:MAG: divergent polysaccharide deacetylase family protein [Alphaproteobacteria bacterium]|nr:divergent polysaccharide deacetylase family protein [Alphaproteobacteria bacterium]
MQKPNMAAIIEKLKGIGPALRARLPGKLGGGRDKEVEPDPYADVPDHLKPTFFERNAHILPVVAAYAALFLAVVGIGTYLLLKSESIEAELEAKIPRVEMTEFDLVDKRGQSSEDSGAGEAAVPGAASEAQSDNTPTSQATETQEASTTETEQAPVRSVDEPDPYAGNLAPHPDPGLVEQIATIGSLPKIGEDGRLPWKVYARPSSSLENRPRIAVVVTNLGLSERSTEAAIALPGAVTLAFSPYAPRIEEWIARAREAGHEVLLGLPMEPRDFPRSDAGLLSLMTSVDEEQNLLNLQRVLSVGSGYIGVVNFQGSGFTASRAAMQPVLEALTNRGLVYLDTLENATSVAPELAEILSTPFATADLVLDQSLSRPMVTSRLSQLELVAKNQKTAIVAVQAFPMLMERVGSWTRDLAGKSMVLSPLSGIITARNRGS